MDVVAGGILPDKDRMMGFEVVKDNDEPLVWICPLISFQHFPDVFLFGALPECDDGRAVDGKDAQALVIENQQLCIEGLSHGKNYNLLIGERTAEDIKISIGSALLEGEEEDYEVRGRDLVTGLPKTISVSSREIHQALKETVQQIVDGIKACLEKTPPELAADIMDRGIIMAGGGSLLRGLDRLISMETNMPVYVCENPLSAVGLGTGRVLENIEVLKRVLVKPKHTL